MTSQECGSESDPSRYGDFHLVRIASSIWGMLLADQDQQAFVLI